MFYADFSIGISWRIRKFPQKYRPEQFRLAALYWPEKVLVFDNSEYTATHQMWIRADKRPSEKTS